MIEHARASLIEIDARITRVATELDSLNALRAGWERYLALLGEPIDSPDQATGPSVSKPASASVSAAASSPPGGEPPAPDSQGARTDRGPTRRQRARSAVEPAAEPVASPRPAERAEHRRAIESPGSVRSDRGTGPVGTPTPALTFTCSWPGCVRTYDTAQRCGAHRFQAHVRQRPGRVAAGAPSAKPRREKRARVTTPRSHPTRSATPKTVDGKPQCPTCKDWFVSDEKLKEHRVKRHNYRAGATTESFLCARCSASFPTREERDEHQAGHPPEPVDRSVGRDPFAQRQIGSTGVQIA